MPELELGIHIMTLELISKTYFINPSHQSVCLYVYASIVARHRFGEKVTKATKTNNVIIG
jgi:hypothetical protein